MKDKAKVYKAIMVEKHVHQKVVVKAKQKQMTLTEYIISLMEKQNG